MTSRVIIMCVDVKKKQFVNLSLFRGYFCVVFFSARLGRRKGWYLLICDMEEGLCYGFNLF